MDGLPLCSLPLGLFTQDVSLSLMGIYQFCLQSQMCVGSMEKKIEED